MIGTALLGNAFTRTPFPGVAAFYRALRDGSGGAANPIFYLSSSPWSFHGMLAHFLAHRDVPTGPLLLRDWGLDQGGLSPSGHREHKLEGIREILDLYPTLGFVLIGDSGQEDPEVVRDAVRAHPGRVIAAYIRDVHPAPARRVAVQAIAEEVAAAGSALILCTDTMAAARDAVERGLMPSAALRSVAADGGERPAA
jgi:phosphatidate phosphatase APP1